MPATPRRLPGRLPFVLAAALALTACGGGDGAGDAPPPPPAASCSVAEQKAWLSDYMDEWYFWTRISPRPSPAPYTTVASYFDALLYTGTSTNFPADRWSTYQSTESFNRFYGDGATLGYGVAVTGVEANGDATRPLWVRYVEPNSPAAAGGVMRGDEVVAIDGTPVATVIAGDDYRVLTPAQAGDRLTLVLRRGGIERTVVLTAAVYSLVPVQGAAVWTSAGVRKLAYLQVKDMISQALTPMETAFAQFKAAGVQDLVLDLRYNGGGLVSTGATLASYVAGMRGNGLAYASLLYNDKRAATNNQRYAFSTLGSSLGLPRVYLLTGPRTCSASEQLINGLRGAGIDVITVGDTTCGKPVGFLPASSCGQTYSVVNFESVNERNEGRYFDGFDASCAVTEDFTAAQGGATDPLLAVAGSLADGGSCPRAAPLDARAQALGLRRIAPRKVEAGERQDMIPR